jgi:hypothetical protein
MSLRNYKRSRCCSTTIISGVQELSLQNSRRINDDMNKIIGKSKILLPKFKRPSLIV